LCDPPLSSIDLNCERMGYEAALLLSQLLAGLPASSRQILIEPRGIITRQSTEVLAIDDEEIARAVRLIRTQACSGLTVEDLLASCSLSSSSLERRFTRLLGRSPKAEIVRVRLQRVRELLAETDLTLTQIADRTGFKHVEYLSAVFKQKIGLSPGQYRAQVICPHFKPWRGPARLSVYPTTGGPPVTTAQCPD
jgi:LacI family transcriptional regulator